MNTNLSKILLIFLFQIASDNSFGQTLILEFNYPLELKSHEDDIIVSCTYFEENDGYYRTVRVIADNYQKINLNFHFKKWKEIKVEIVGGKTDFKLNLILYPGKKLTVKTNILIRCRYGYDCKDINYFNSKYTFEGFNNNLNKYYAWYYSIHKDNFNNESDKDDYNPQYKTDSLRNIYIKNVHKRIQEQSLVINSMIPGTNPDLEWLKKLLIDNYFYKYGKSVLYKMADQKISRIQYFDILNGFSEYEPLEVNLPSFILFCSAISDDICFPSNENISNETNFQSYVNNGKFKAGKSWKTDYDFWFKSRKSNEKWDLNYFITLLKDEKIRLDIKNDFYTNFKFSVQYFADSLYLADLMGYHLNKNITYNMVLNRLEGSFNLEKYNGGIGISYYPYFLIKHQFIPTYHLSLFYKYLDSAQLKYVSEITDQHKKLTIQKAEIWDYCKNLGSDNILDSNSQIQSIIKDYPGKIIICQYFGLGNIERRLEYLELLIKKFSRENIVFINFCDFGSQGYIHHFEQFLLWFKERNLDTLCNNYQIRKGNCLSIIHPTNNNYILVFDKQGKYIPLTERFIYASFENDKGHAISSAWLSENFKLFKVEKKIESPKEDEKTDSYGIDDYSHDAKPITLFDGEISDSENQSTREKDSLQKIELAKPKWEVLPYNTPEVLKMSLSREIEAVIKGRITAPMLNSNWINEELFKNEGWYCIEEPENNCIYLSKNNFKTRFSEEPKKWIMNNDKTICYSIADKEFPVKINLTFNPKKDMLTYNGMSYLVFYQDSNLIVLLKGK